ncbi:MAG: D-aminoacyl-tRNA deacylase [Candidatus Micrarchaeia archaeon]
MNIRLVCAKKNFASINIAKQIKEISPSTEILESECDVLDIPCDFSDAEIIVLSSHKSKNPVPMLTVHAPGNWDSADFGGNPKTLNICSANLMRKIISEIDKNNKEMKLNWKVVLECDHHGPTCKIPITFVEIGSTQKEWENKTAGLVIAKSILEAIKRTDVCETVFAVGGGHYSEKFTKLAVLGKYSIGHILPKYKIDNIDEDVFIQAVKKNDSLVRKILIDENCSINQKNKINAFCRKYGILVEKC